MSRVGTLAPFYFQTWVVACPSAVFQCYGSAYLINILYAGGLAMNIAIMEYRSRLMVGGIERLAAEQGKPAFVIYSRTAQGIVGTFEIAVVEYRMFCPNEWAEVKS